MKIKVKNSQIEMLNLLKSKMLLKNNEIYIICDFKIEDIKVKKIWFKKEVIVKYLTDINIAVYDIRKRAMLKVDCDNFYFEQDFYYESFYKWRDNFVNLQEQFNQFGFEIVKKPVEETVENS